MCAKHYENSTMLSRVTAKNVGDVFLRHTVYVGLHTVVCFLPGWRLNMLAFPVLKLAYLRSVTAGERRRRSVSSVCRRLRQAVRFSPGVFGFGLLRPVALKTGNDRQKDRWQRVLTGCLTATMHCPGSESAVRDRPFTYRLPCRKQRHRHATQFVDRWTCGNKDADQEKYESGSTSNELKKHQRSSTIETARRTQTRKETITIRFLFLYVNQFLRSLKSTNTGI